VGRLVVLNLGPGDWQRGFAAVTVQVWEAGAGMPMQITGQLPPELDLEPCYRQWQRLYTALYRDRAWQSNWRRPSRSSQPPLSDELRNNLGDTLGNNLEPPELQGFEEFEIDEDDITYVSRAEFDACGAELKRRLNQWLSHSSFQNIDRQLRTQLLPSEEIRLIITAEADRVLQFPWRLWSFFDDFPKAELGLSPLNYQRAQKTAIAPQSKVRILAILGDSRGIDIERDRALLQQLPQAAVTLLVEPSQAEISNQLWSEGWDILFFAGHSASALSDDSPGDASGASPTSQGEIQINPTTALTMEQLKYGLQQAITQGLQLAIFNSCDGLGLARNLADLQIPQVIVMREPVPDRVAQEFLQRFLSALATGMPLYLAMRQSREKLQDLEADFPGATWLPVICQNPAELPCTWPAWQPPTARTWTQPRRQDWQRLGLQAALATVGVLALRLTGLLQPLELWGLDQGLQLRPESPPDSRLLVVTITEADIQAQKNEPRKGSLSDRTLYRLLSKLQQHQAAAIGLDLYRDFAVEPNRPELTKLLRNSDRFIAICKRPDPVHDPKGIDPPPEVPISRVGFSDFIEDSDGVLRRQLLLLSPNPISPCATNRSLAVQLAWRYFQHKKIEASFSPTGDLTFGSRVIGKLGDRTSGYQRFDASGSQLLLNYRGNPRKIAQQATVDQILNQPINPNAIKDRVVIIGVTANSSGDYWATPYGRGFGDRVPGVFLQAQMVSQLLSLANQQRPTLGVWNLGGETLWILGWAAASGIGLLYIQRQPLRVLISATIPITITGFCLILLVNGTWAPWFPPVLASLLTQALIAPIPLTSFRHR
jgi:CHASE2 domain-containing sensor protein